MQQERVAVGLGGRRDLSADGTGSAGFGIDHDGLFEDRLEHGSERTPDHIGSTTGWKRVDDRHGARGVCILGEPGTR